MINFDKNSQILIVGCGRLGANIANNLSEKDLDVVVVDKNKDSFNKLSKTFSGLYVEGDATDINLLKELEIYKVNTVIVVTDKDNVNILIGQIANCIYNIKNIIIRVYDCEKKCVYDDLGIKTILPSLLSENEVKKIIFGE